MKVSENLIRKLPYVLAVVLAIVLSFTILADRATSMAGHEKEIASIDQKISTVLKLTAGSAGASVVVSALPDDTATPIAEKLADISSYLLIVLSVLYLEKYLLVVTGFACFKILLPLACLAMLWGILWNNKYKACKHFAKRLFAFGLCFYMVIPASLFVSDMIYSIYQDSIDATIEAAENAVDEMEEEKAENEAQTGLSGIVSSVVGSVTDAAGKAIHKATDLLNHFIDVTAVLIVTTCIIPVVVFIFFVWLILMFLGIDMQKRNGIPVPMGLFKEQENK